MYNILEINSIEQLGSIRKSWDRLFGQTRQASFFQTYDWFEIYWHHFGESKQMRVLVVLFNEKPIGIVPLVIQQESTRAGKVRTLTYPLSDWGSYYGPLGPNPTVTLRIAMRHLAETPRDWDLIDLRWVDREGLDHDRTEQAMSSAGLQPHCQPWNQTAIVEMDGSWNSYWMNLPKKWRGSVRRSKRLLAERGDVRFVRYRPQGLAFGQGDPRWDLYDQSVAIARRSWQGSSLTGTTLCDPSVYGFLRETHAAAARLGMLDMNLIYIDDRPVAFNYNYHHDKMVYGLRTGFDPELAQAGPGKAILAHLIEDGYARGDRYFDIGVGMSHYKLYWANSFPISYRYTYFSPESLKTRVLRLKRWYQVRRFGENYLPGAKKMAI